MFAELVGHFVPDEEVDAKGEVAFCERFPERGNPVVLRWGCEDQHVEIGLGRAVHWTREP